MNKEMDLINRYMNKKELSKNLKNRVLNYLEYLHGIHFERINVEEEEVVKKLSQSLQEDILKECNGKLIRKFQILNKYFS